VGSDGVGAEGTAFWEGRHSDARLKASGLFIFKYMKYDSVFLFLSLNNCFTFIYLKIEIVSNIRRHCITGRIYRTINV